MVKQAVYLLEVASQTLQLIADDADDVQNVHSIFETRFSFDGKLVVVVQSLGRDCHVYTRQGQKLSRFEISAGHSSCTHTFAQPDRVAVSLGFNFEVWELQI